MCQRDRFVPLVLQKPARYASVNHKKGFELDKNNENKPRTEEENNRTAGAAIGGAIFGASVGGPVGAVIGGIFGAVFGEMANDSKNNEGGPRG